MKAKEEKPKKRGATKKILAAAILGVIAGVLLAPKAGRELRKDLRKIMQKMEKEIIQKAGKTKKLGREKYDEIVEIAANSYAKAKKIKKEDLKEIVKDLKKCWTDIAKKLKAK